MIVFVVREGEDSVILFSNHEAAVEYLEPKIKELWAKVLNPKLELGLGWGGSSWRVQHYRDEVGWDLFLAQRLKTGIEAQYVCDTVEQANA